MGPWRARITGPEGAAAALALRARLFRDGAADRDGFDATARHLIVTGPAGPAACARLWVHRGRTAERGYTGQFYDLSGFAASFPTAIELGRVGIVPGADPADVPRLVLGLLARLARKVDAAALFGCASFPADGAGMAGLSRHVSSAIWRPRRRTDDGLPGTVIALPDRPGPLPPLLRLYLTLGAGLSDHAVRDPDLGTIHVFTGLPIAAIPANRSRLLNGLMERAG